MKNTLPARLLYTSMVLLAAPLGCAAGSPEDDTASEASEVGVEQAPIATALTELRAGQPYLPGVDESPLAITGDGCVAGPKLTLTGGEVTATATVVHSRQGLGRELGLDLAGIPIPVGGVPGLTASAGLAVSTTFDSQSAVVLFQAAGKYESVITGADAVPSFDAARVPQCGYGYIARASHRVAAALVVSVRSTDRSRSVKASIGGGAGSASARASISNLIEQGNLEISIRFAADPIPNLGTAPFADALMLVGSTPEDKAKARERLDAALGWLANAQATISSYLIELRNRPEAAPAAPTQSVSFRFYPGTPSSVRTAVNQAATAASETKRALATAITVESTWAAFAKDVGDGVGGRWNIPGAPARSVDELLAKKRELLDDEGGRVRGYQETVSAQFDRCTDVIRNDAGRSDFQLGQALKSECATPPALPFDLSRYDVRPIAVVSIDEVGGGDRCPEGLRRPYQRELEVFAPWSRTYTQQTGNGIWTEDDSCALSSSWLVDGRTDCSPTFSGRKGLRICLSTSGEILPAP